ncbi:phosphoglycerate/bisphosphoglycerate mutase [Thraustotheca clavata]|uniref:Phosphoglycerate/bisphosphoglycerate mutase n=1 Tax=Thraustotheca clavata TaxID=74557 RepID=A0A1W0A6S3_9STRA|nr:phosphoglycerate/bisphosphoglycerate mutase [Thraustotheca clavata]
MNLSRDVALIAASVAITLLCVRIWTSRRCTRQRNRKRLPHRIIMVRHGQSEGNVNPDLYRDIPDNAMPLTDLGKSQARAAGKEIKEIIGNESVRCIVSPCTRTIETFEEIMVAWGPDAASIPWTEEPRIREQDFGNFQNPEQIRECKIQRKKFGGFFYRFPSGESPADVYDRISSFLESLHRMFMRKREQNYILVAHGVAIRILLMRYFRYTIAEYEEVENFHNGEFVVMEHNGDGVFRITKVIHPHVDPKTFDVTVHEATRVRLNGKSMRKSSLSLSYDNRNLCWDDNPM